MKTTRLIVIVSVIGLLIAALFVAAPVGATAPNCSSMIVDTGGSWQLQGDCTTDTSIVVPDGYTLNGNGHTITGVDPAGGHFLGAVVVNGGSSMYVENVTVMVSGLANTCDASAPVDNRLRGVMFNGAGGELSHSVIVGVFQAMSGCQEGNAVEVRNGPFDGTHPATVSVDIDHNVIDQFMKTGIVANGDVSVDIEHNVIGSSADQDYLAANSVQYGFGATGTLMYNSIDGNQWSGASDDVATAVLLFDSNGVNVSDNNIGGNADVGVYVFGDNNVVNNNRIFESGADVNQHGYDIGVGNYGTNIVTNNKVRGYDTPYDGVTGGNNKVVASPHN